MPRAPSGYRSMCSMLAPTTRSTQLSLKSVQQNVGALMVGTDPFLLGQRDQLAGLAAMYFLREFVQAGGLLSYGPDIHRGYRQAGAYTGYILSGSKPAD